MPMRSRLPVDEGDTSSPGAKKSIDADSPTAEDDDDDSNTERESDESQESASVNPKIPAASRVANPLSTQKAVVAMVSVLVACFLVVFISGLTDEMRGHSHDSGTAEGAGTAGRSGRDDVAGTLLVTPTSVARRTIQRRRPFTLGDYEETREPDKDAWPSSAVECDTEVCRWHRRLVNEKLNVTVDPCIDFYSYVCSSAWELDGDRPYRAAGRAFLVKEVTRYLREHVHSLPAAAKEGFSNNEHNFLDHSSLLLTGCLRNQAFQDANEWGGIRALLRQVGLEDWPYIVAPPSPPGQPFRLDAILKLVDRQLAIFPIVDVSLRKFADSDSYVLHVDAPKNFLFVQYVVQKNDETLPYNEIVRRTLTLWKTLPRSDAMAQDVVHFEAELLKAASQPFKAVWKKKQNVVYNVKEFPWLSTFHMDEYLLHFRKDADEVVVLNPPYISNLSDILRKPHPRTILNFFGLLVVVQVAPLLPRKSAPRDLIRLGYPSFQHHLDARTQSCFHLVHRLFPHGFRWILRDILARTADLDRQWAVTTRNMVSSLAHTFREGTMWMQDEDVARAIRRLKSLQVEYLAGRESEEGVDRYYAPINATYRPNDLVGYYGRLLKASLQKYWESGVGGANYDARFTEHSTNLDDAWTRSPESVFRLYLTSSSISAASLVTRANYPAALFPLMGADVTRALFLASLDEPKWSKWTQDRFHSLLACLLDRYKRSVRKYTGSATDVRAFLTDIFADNAVLKPLMQAFRRFSHGVLSVPGHRKTKMTAWRFFFVNYAAGFCVPGEEAAQSRDRMRYRLGFPPRARVNLALLDLQEFRRAFKCRNHLGKSRCPIWGREEEDAGSDTDMEQ
ncbi:neprilysin-1-like [Haemaphysalis longicornis]